MAIQDQTTFGKKIEEKIYRKLNSWKYAECTKGGKLTLIQASLSNLPTYQLPVFKTSVKVYKNIERQRKNFLWKNNKYGFHFYLTNWKLVTS